MAELKTQKNDTNVLDFIQTVDDDAKRQDCFTLLKLFEECTSEKPTMWGTVATITNQREVHRRATGR